MSLRSVAVLCLVVWSGGDAAGQTVGANLTDLFAGSNAGTWRLVAGVPEGPAVDGARVVWLGLQNTSRDVRVVCLAAWWYSGDATVRIGGGRLVTDTCLADSEFAPVLPGQTMFVAEAMKAADLKAVGAEVWMAVSVTERGGATFDVPWHGTIGELIVKGHELAGRPGTRPDAPAR
jgi:hypothetical protein